jgi:hypothetical protein
VLLEEDELLKVLQDDDEDDEELLLAVPFDVPLLPVAMPTPLDVMPDVLLLLEPEELTLVDPAGPLVAPSPVEPPSTVRPPHPWTRITRAKARLSRSALTPRA